jgi:hypothetical protein
MLKIDLSDIADITRSISEYEMLTNSFTQRGTKEEKELLTDFWNKKVVKRETSTWMTSHEYEQWKEINFHVVAQTWGNTSCGWQGIGGAAMTKAYTVIIENGWSGLVCVFYFGKLAYMCEMDDKYKVYVEKGFRGLPGHGDCHEKLTVLYKSK